MPQGSVSGFHPPNINKTYLMLKDALESSQPTRGPKGRELEVDVPPTEQEISLLLFRLMAKAPEKAMDVLSSMGVGPEDFVAAITDHDAAQGLSFDVDEERLSTAMDDMAVPETGAAQAAQLFGSPLPQTVPGLDERNVKEFVPPPRDARTKDDAYTLPLEVDPNAPRMGPPTSTEDAGPGGWSTRPVPQTPFEISPPPVAPLPVFRPPTMEVPDAASPSPTGFDAWLRRILPNPYPSLDAPDAPPAPAPAPATPPAPVTAGSDGTPSVQGAPPQPSYVPTASYAEGGSANTGLAAPGAAPIVRDDLVQKANLVNTLNNVLEGVGQVGDPAVPEVATPGPPGGAGGIQRGALLELLARQQQMQPNAALRLGQALQL